MAEQTDPGPSRGHAAPEETPHLKRVREERERREALVKLAHEHAGPIREIAEQAIDTHAVNLHLIAHAKEVGLLEPPTDEGRKRGVAYRLWYDFEKNGKRWCGWLGFTQKLLLQSLDKLEPLHQEIFLNRD